MRLRNLIYNEFYFLWKYGIIALYGIFTVIYLCLLGAIPISAKAATATVLVFTDPTAMGLFFMGAVILLEKSQRVESSLGVSPITISEYIIAKTVSIMVTGCVVAIILCLYANTLTLPCIVGVALSSVLFSLCGLIVGANINSLNGFMIATVPFEIILCLPPILYLFGVIKSSLWLIHPGVAAIRLISGRIDLWQIAVVSITIWIIPAFALCKKAVAKSFVSMGGAKL